LIGGIAPSGSSVAFTNPGAFGSRTGVCGGRAAAGCAAAVAGAGVSGGAVADCAQATPVIVNPTHNAMFTHVFIDPYLAIQTQELFAMHRLGKYYTDHYLAAQR
jgi:hypothetical protein